MKKRTRIIMASFLTIVVAVGCVFLFHWNKGEPVETKEEAIAIAEKYVLKKYGSDFSKYGLEYLENSEYEIRCSLKDEIWVVYYDPIRQKLPEGVYRLGGGGPQVRIEQSTGKVISCFLLK